MNRMLLSSGIFLVVAVLVHQIVAGGLTLIGQFNPSNAAGLCGIGYDHVMDNVWVYDCNSNDIQSYASSGEFLTAIPRPGEATNDVDIEFTPETILFGAGSTSLPVGTLLFINGETDAAEIYALDKGTGDIIETLNTSFGFSHVVGGVYHAERDTFFLVQDRQPSGTANDSLIAEIDPITGNVLNSFQIADDYSVNFGDIEINTETGHLFVVSSDESTIAEFTSTGILVQELALPAVGSLSGIGLNEATGEGWVSNTAGTVSRLGGFIPTSNLIFLPLVVKD